MTNNERIQANNSGLREAIRLANSLPDAGGAGSGTPAIIDVLALPTEGISKSSFYRVMKAQLLFDTYIQESYTCYCVDGLPETGEPATNLDNTAGNIYFNIWDNEVYGYVDSMLSMGLGVPEGWYPGATLLGALGYEYMGAIFDISEASDDGTFRLLLSKDYYIYDNEWCKVPFACEKAPKFDITWDGDMTDKLVIDGSQIGFEDTFFVKVSDKVLTKAELTGAWLVVNYTDGYTEDGQMPPELLDDTTYPGAIVFEPWGLVVHDASALSAALGVPEGYITNGVYFPSVTDHFYTTRLQALPRITKIDGKYVDLSDGLSPVAISGNYYDLVNCPTIYTDVVRYVNGQGLTSAQKQYARNNIDVYSKWEVDSAIDSAIDHAIENAIYNAIGGSY